MPRILYWDPEGYGVGRGKIGSKNLIEVRQDLQQYLARRWQDRQQARSNSATVFEHRVLHQAIEETEQHLEVETGQPTPRLVVVEGSRDL